MSSKGILNKLQGDKVVWGVVFLMMLASLVIVYSAVSNLAWRSLDGGNVFGMIFKHGMFLAMSFLTIIVVHRIPIKYYNLASLAIPFILLLLGYTLFQGKTIDGANASRWVSLPFIGISIQSSTVAAIVLFIHVARYLSKIQDKKPLFKETILPLWTPVILVGALILPANFSTAALIMANVGILLLIGRYPLKHIAVMSLAGVILFSTFIGVAMKYPDLFPNRVNTWTSRIESFFSGKPGNEQYQVESAKVAIALGGITGQGPGKSVQKNHLPQSSSDFIFAILIEEFGLFGAFSLIVLYITFLIRVVRIAGKAKNTFSTLLVFAMGIPIVLQAMINMLVAVGLFPVTGQPLPLISNGGTSILLIGFSVGIILGVSRETQMEDIQTQEIDGEKIEEQNELSKQIENNEFEQAL